MRIANRLRYEALEERRLLVADVALEVRIDNEPVTMPGPQVEIGSQTDLTYLVTNPGTEQLESIVVNDGHGVGAVVAVQPEAGTLEATFPEWEIGTMLRHPTQPIIYATLLNLNQVVVINSETLTVEEMIFTGSSPRHMAITPTGDQLYVVNGFTQLMSVIDTATNAKIDDIVLPEYAIDVEVAADGQLLVMFDDYVKKIDPATDAVGPELISRSYTAFGELVINESRDRLFITDPVGSPTPFYQFDITTEPATLLFNSRHVHDTSGGFDLDISNDSQHVIYSNSWPGSATVYRVSDMAVVGTMHTGRNGAITYSHDDSVVYSGHDDYEIEIWDTETFLQVDTINHGIRDEPTEMVVDRTGAHLFTVIGGMLRVFATGRGEPINIGDTNQNRLLDPGEQWQYESKVAAASGLQTVDALVEAESSVGESVFDMQSASYTGAYQIVIEADVNGSQSTPSVSAGEALALRYEVSNPGLLSIDVSSIVDDNGTPEVADDIEPTFVGGDANGNDLLDPGETWLYESTTVADLGNVSNLAQVIGMPHDSNGPLEGIVATVETNLSYFGRQAAVTIEFQTNGESADAPVGVMLEVGDPVQWTYEVTNTGNVPLTEVEVVDSNGTPAIGDDFTPLPTFSQGRQGELLHTIPNLEGLGYTPHPTEPIVYVAAYDQNSVAVINTETLELEDLIFVGPNPSSMVVSADGTKLFVINLRTNFLTIVDTASRTVADRIYTGEFIQQLALASDGQLYAGNDDWLRKYDYSTGEFSEDLVHHTYVDRTILISDLDNDRLYLANEFYSNATIRQFDIAGDTEPLEQLAITQNNGGYGQDFVLSADGEFAAYAHLSPRSFSLFRTSDMIQIGSFQADDSPDQIVFSADGSLVFTASTRDEIEVFSTQTYLSQGTFPVDGEALDLWVDPAGKHLFATFDNETRVYHTGFHVPADSNVGDLNFNGLLDPNETWYYTAEGTAEVGLHSAVATVTANTLDGDAVASNDLSHYVTGAEIVVDAFLNGINTSRFTNLLLDSRIPATWTYTVINPGQVPLANITVTDDNGSGTDPSDDIHADYVSGDVNGNSLLDPLEVWRLAGTGKPGNGHRCSFATVTGTLLDSEGNPVPGATISSIGAPSYFTALTPELQLEASVNGNDADTPTGPFIAAGSDLEWVYELSNVGDATLTINDLVDDRGTPDANDDIALSPTTMELPAFGNLAAHIEQAVPTITPIAFEAHPTLPYVFVTTTNSLLWVFQANTFERLAEFSLGGIPEGMTVSNDGARLYVSRSSRSDLIVLDVNTLELLPALPIPHGSFDVEVGADGNLFVLTRYDEILRIDPVTGLEIAPPITVGFTGEGQINLNPAKDRLFYARFETSSGRVEEYDLTQEPPELLHTLTATSYARDFALGTDGTFAAFTTDFGQNNGQVAIYDTSDWSVIGYLPVASRAYQIAFSADNTLAYTLHSGSIAVWGLDTFTLIDEFDCDGTPEEAYFDPWGNNLYTSYRYEMRVFEAGLQTVEVPVGDTNRNGLLDPGEAWQYHFDGIAEPGQYAGTATIAGTPVDGLHAPLDGFLVAADTAPVHYFGLNATGSTVISRNLFYNSSILDGNDPGINTNDDHAIASNLIPLLPGETQGPENVSSFAAGINGVIVDLAFVPDGATLDPATDFEFRIGSGGDSSTWPLAPPPTDFAVREGDGEGGSDRIVFAWDDGSIENQWLRVVTKANPNTGLSKEDVFHYSHMLADVSGDGVVNAIDFALVRANPKNFLDPAGSNNPYDIDRDGKVNATDLLLIRDRATTIGQGLAKVDSAYSKRMVVDEDLGFLESNAYPTEGESSSPIPEEKSREITTGSGDTTGDEEMHARLLATAANGTERDLHSEPFDSIAEDDDRSAEDWLKFQTILDRIFASS